MTYWKGFLYMAYMEQGARGCSKPRAYFHAAVDVVRHFLWSLVCLVVGHEVMDLDPGDPEVGPQPYIVCQRCWKEWV